RTATETSEQATSTAKTETSQRMDLFVAPVSSDLESVLPQLSLAKVPEERTLSESTHSPKASPAPPPPVRRRQPDVTFSDETINATDEAILRPGHRSPRLTASEVVRRAVLEHVRRRRRLRTGETDRPGKGRGSKNPRYIPADVRRDVWKRDEGRCTFVSS